MSNKRFTFRTIISRNAEPSYRHLIVTVRDKQGSCLDQDIRLLWQTGRKDSEWYGFNYEIQGRSLAKANQSIKFLRRVLKSVEVEYGFNPSLEAVLASLEKIADEVVYDERLHEYVRIGDLQPAEYLPYSDDGPAYGEKYGWITVLAHDEDEARRLLTKNLAENPRTGNRLRAWIKANEPIKLTRGRYPEDDRPWRVKVVEGLFNQPEPVEAEIIPADLAT